MNEFGPEPNDKTELSLWSFAKAANWSLLHPLDYDRFYTFVVLAHQRGNWSPDKVRRILGDYGVSFEIIENMVYRFEIGISYWSVRESCGLTGKDSVDGASVYQYLHENDASIGDEAMAAVLRS